MRTSGWWARLKARLSAAVVLPQPLVGEVMPSEVQPFCRSTRRILVRIMSKVVCAGSVSAKVTIRCCAISCGSGSKAASSAQAGAGGAV